MHARRFLSLTIVLLALATVAAGCGSSSKGSSTQSAQSAQRRGGLRFARDPKVVACLKKQGVTLPARQQGRPRPNGSGAGAGAARFQKLRAALTKCGVTLPQPGQVPPGGGPPPTTSAS
jgi:hypothetical protein